MDKTFISGFFGHIHTEVNPEMIPNLSQRAVKSLKIERFFIFKNKIVFSIFRDKNLKTFCF
jgi:hypothetical protein